MNFWKEDIFNSIGDPFEDRIRELKNRFVEVIGAATQRGNGTEHVRKRLRGIGNGIDSSKIHCTGVSEGEERENRKDVLFERIMDESSLKFVKDTKP